MSEQEIKLTRKQAKRVLELTFPDYTGRRIRLIETDHVILHNLNWAGGSKSEYVAVRCDGKTQPLVVPAPWLHNWESQRVNIPIDFAVVERKFYCGKDMGIYIYLRYKEQLQFNTWHENLLPQ